MNYNIKRIIPDSITSLNLLSGTISVYFSFIGKLDIAFYLILAGAFFDFFDGFSARLLKVTSEFGVQLDSLADIITFGFAPAAMLFYFSSGLTDSYFFMFSPFILVVFSALRLAKFNIDKRQTSGFLGLPTPANSLICGAIAYSSWSGIDMYSFITSDYWVILAFSITFSFLLISDIPLFSLKFESLRFKQNYFRYIFIILSFLSLLIFKIIALPIIIAVYIFSGIFKSIYPLLTKH
jgi:CDP-diacylglycerol--serine O-phosphatidyltransferase